MKVSRFNGLDHLRAAAIVLVLMYHYLSFRHPDWLEIWGRYGWTGVDLFFVLSGFLISGQLFGQINRYQTISLKAFYIRRFFRIIPPYVFTLAIYLYFPSFREREALPATWKFLTFTHNYELDVINKGTFSHAWSLCIEEQFYLLLPLILLLFIKIKGLDKLIPILLALLLTSVLFRSFAWRYLAEPEIGTANFWKLWYMHIYYPTHTRLDSLAIGVIIGFLFENSEKFKKLIHGNGMYFFFAGLVLLAFSFWICHAQYSRIASIYGFTIVGAAYGLLLISAVSESSFLSKKSNLWTRQLADLSYAIYLTHKGVIHIVQTVFEDIDLSENIILVICLIACILSAGFYRYLIERPSDRIKKAILNQK